MYEGPFVTSPPLSLPDIYGAKPVLRFQVGVSISPLAQMHHWRDVAFVHIIVITFELCGRAL